MVPKIIRSSRQKLFLYLSGCLVFVAVVGFSLSQDTENDNFINTLGIVSFGLCTSILGWNLVRPEKMVLDEEGFTLGGGFWFKPKRVRWRDVDKFFIDTRGMGGSKVIAYKLKPSAQKHSALWLPNADGILSPTWTLSNEAMVAELNFHVFRVQGVSDDVPASGLAVI